MTITPINLGVQSNPARNSAVGAARLINCYAEDAGDEAKIRFPIFVSDGFESWASLTGGGAVRALFQFSDTVAYVVATTKVFKVTSGGVVSEVTGSISPTGRVTIARNRREPNAQVGFACGGKFYVIDTGADALAEVDISSLSSGTLVSLEGLDGYFILTFDNGEFFVTNIDNATVIDGLDFDKAESHPDAITSSAVWGRDAVLFGTNSMEFWQNTGASPFPLERTAATSIGCFAPASVVEIVIVRRGASATDNVIWAATDSDGAYAGIMMLNGYTGAKISTTAVDRSVSNEPYRASISATKWSRGGHVFYAISGSTFSWVYDTSTGFWHERKSQNMSRWRVAHVMAFAGTNIVSDTSSEQLYDMKPTVYDEDGDLIEAVLIPPAVHAFPHPLRINSVHLDTAPGVGLASGDLSDVDPSITMQHSRDNGETWSNVRPKKLGKITEKKKRVKWIGGIGQSTEDGFLFRFSMSSRVFRSVSGMAVDATAVKS